MNSAYVIGEPLPSQQKELRLLWQESFCDDDTFLDTFETTAFSTSRCRCVTINNKVVAALYWFDCSMNEKKIAYIYAVATSAKFRGQGICHSLMEGTHQHLAKLGYSAALLSPATDTLFAFYKSLGYREGTRINEISLHTETLNQFEDKHISIRTIQKQEFCELRRKFLPSDSVLQENENIDFLATQAHFFTGNHFLLTAFIEGTHLRGIEFLGDADLLPDIMNKLHCNSAHIRMPGTDKPFTMYYPFDTTLSTPYYFGFVFD